MYVVIFFVLPILAMRITHSTCLSNLSFDILSINTNTHEACSLFNHVAGLWVLSLACTANAYDSTIFHFGPKRKRKRNEEMVGFFPDMYETFFTVVCVLGKSGSVCSSFSFLVDRMNVKRTSTSRPMRKVVPNNIRKILYTQTHTHRKFLLSVIERFASSLSINNFTFSPSPSMILHSWNERVSIDLHSLLLCLRFSPFTDRLLSRFRLVSFYIGTNVYMQEFLVVLDFLENVETSSFLFLIIFMHECLKIYRNLWIHFHKEKRGHQNKHKLIVGWILVNIMLIDCWRVYNVL